MGSTTISPKFRSVDDVLFYQFQNCQKQDNRIEAAGLFPQHGPEADPVLAAQGSEFLYLALQSVPRMLMSDGLDGASRLSASAPNLGLQAGKVEAHIHRITGANGESAGSGQGGKPAGRVFDLR